jgi:hypothetical protein
VRVGPFGGLAKRHAWDCVPGAELVDVGMACREMDRSSSINVASQNMSCMGCAEKESSGDGRQSAYWPFSYCDVTRSSQRLPRDEIVRLRKGVQTF